MTHLPQESGHDKAPFKVGAAPLYWCYDTPSLSACRKFNGCVSRNQAERSEGPSKLPVCQRLRRGGCGGGSLPGGRVSSWSVSPWWLYVARSAHGVLRANP